MSYLAKITIYPFKALDGLSVTSATILASGALQHDRMFAIVDESGMFVNGKRNALVHRLRAHFNLAERTLTLRIQDTEQTHTFQLDTEREALNSWLSTYFGRAVTVIEDTTSGFPDDTNAPGPTIIGTSTLAEVASWFPALEGQSPARRFRANLEISAPVPFWEDRLFAEAGDVVRFQIGDVLFEGVNPCQRCVVPSRNPDTGEVIPHFQQIFMRNREASLPAWSTPSRFNHFYRLSINTRIPASQAGKMLQIGDDVRIL